MLREKSLISKTLGLTDPFRELRKVHEDMDRMFASLWRKEDGFPTAIGEWAPNVDMFEEKDHFVVKAELPGIEKKDVSLTLRDDTLIITGDRKEEKVEKGEHFLVREGAYGHFRRVLPLPVEVKSEGIKAEFENGVLKVTLPKSDVSKSKEVKIEVK